MLPANVKLSKNELSLVCDEQFILTKNRIIDKVYQLFGMLSTDFSKELTSYKSLCDPEIFKYTPKIYKGEQYKGLPYVMLDHPRYFNKHHAFAIRCFFWWGNFFSLTLHLEGKYKQTYFPAIIGYLRKKNSLNNWYYCINNNQWQHDFETTNYSLLTGNLLEEANSAVTHNNFLKIAKKIPLEQWNEVYDFYTINFSEILIMLTQPVR